MSDDERAARNLWKQQVDNYSFLNQVHLARRARHNATLKCFVLSFFRAPQVSERAKEQKQEREREREL